MNDIIELQKIVLELYCLYNEKLSNRKTKIKFILDDRKAIILKNFCIHIDKKLEGSLIGKEYIKMFFEYSFGLKIGSVDKYGRKDIFVFNTIVSKKNFDRFLIHKKQYHVVKTKVRNKNKDFKIQTKNDQIEVRERRISLIIEIDKFEEEEKKKFFNKEKGFINCNLFTTLFKPKSELCQSCKFSEECKENLKLNLPMFFKIRING